jgi:hypothetical protein
MSDKEYFEEQSPILDYQNTIDETRKHILTVQRTVLRLLNSVMEQALSHDSSKLESPEIDTFTEFTPKLKNCTYGSDDYAFYLKMMKPALDHHYQNNRHHPEHFAKGIEEMSIVDIIEMFCDWFAATKRHADGDIRKSLKINKKRFRINPQLIKILENTVPILETIERGRPE